MAAFSAPEAAPAAGAIAASPIGGMRDYSASHHKTIGAFRIDKKNFNLVEYVAWLREIGTAGKTEFLREGSTARSIQDALKAAGANYGFHGWEGERTEPSRRHALKKQLTNLQQVFYFLDAKGESVLQEGRTFYAKSNPHGLCLDGLVLELMDFVFAPDSDEKPLLHAPKSETPKKTAKKKKQKKQKMSAFASKRWRYEVPMLKNLESKGGYVFESITDSGIKGTVVTTQSAHPIRFEVTLVKGYPISEPVLNVMTVDQKWYRYCLAVEWSPTMSVRDVLERFRDPSSSP